MNELQARHIVDAYDAYTAEPWEEQSQVYLKVEADQALANKDHEIAELKKSISRLLNTDVDRVMDEVVRKTLIYGDGLVPVEHAMRLVVEVQHQKYRRCLNAASYWVAVSYQCVDGKYRQRAERHHRKWLELAGKFEKDKMI